MGQHVHVGIGTLCAASGSTKHLIHLMESLPGLARLGAHRFRLGPTSAARPLETHVEPKKIKTNKQKMQNMIYMIV